MTSQCEYVLPGAAGAAWITMHDAVPEVGDQIWTQEGGFTVARKEWMIGATEKNSVYRRLDHVRIVLARFP